MMKIGLMGGSFDPVHLGHVAAARSAVEKFGLDRVIFLPAAQTPRKSENALTASHHRVTMLRDVISHDSQFTVSEYEVEQGGVSFTIHTARHFREQFPEAKLFWIIGADQVASLDHWRGIDELAALVDFIYLDRPGHSAPTLPSTAGLRLHRCEGEFVDISSTELRARLRRGDSVSEFMPPESIAYIRQCDLYH